MREFSRNFLQDLSRHPGYIRKRWFDLANDPLRVNENADGNVSKSQNGNEHRKYAPHMEMPVSALKWTAKAFLISRNGQTQLGRSLPDSMNDERTDGHFTCRMDRYDFTICSRPPFYAVFFASRLAITAAPRVACKRGSKCRTICAVALLFLYRKFFMVSSRRVNVTFSPFFPISAFNVRTLLFPYFWHNAVLRLCRDTWLQINAVCAIQNGKDLCRS